MEPRKQFNVQVDSSSIYNEVESNTSGHPPATHYQRSGQTQLEIVDFWLGFKLLLHQTLLLQ
jgi:hypothetical protein